MNMYRTASEVTLDVWLQRSSCHVINIIIVQKPQLSPPCAVALHSMAAIKINKNHTIGTLLVKSALIVYFHIRHPVIH